VVQEEGTMLSKNMGTEEQISSYFALPKNKKSPAR
jgi:hypothetical protein